MMTCFGIAAGVFWAVCSQPAQPAPTGKAPFCGVMQQAGGALKPSRKDTPESARYMNRLAAAAKGCPR
jgi:hypothetical protein